MVKGYKALNPDMTCRDFKFKLNKTYKIEGSLELCRNGFHFCENFFDVYNYYPKETDIIVAEVEASGEIIKEGDKSVSSEIKLTKILSDLEKLELWIKRTNSGDWNSGDWNSGYGNSGDWNSGDWNSGNRNSGDWNSGYGNSGYGNSGYGNSGYGNSGNRNSGDWNSGYGNSGNRNSGDWNSGDGNSGYFNTKVPVYFFNKPSSLEYTKELEDKIRSLNVKPILEWIGTSLMTEKEKTDNPSYKIAEGFLRKTDRHDWRYLTHEDKDLIKSLPNFDDSVFKKISGISLLEEETLEVVINGVTKKVNLKKAKELGLIE